MAEAVLAPAQIGVLNGNHCLLSTEEAKLVARLLEAGQEHLFTDWPAPGTQDREKKAFLQQLLQLDRGYSGGLVAYIREPASDESKALLTASAEGKNPFDGYALAVPKARGPFNQHFRFVRWRLPLPLTPAGRHLHLCLMLGVSAQAVETPRLLRKRIAELEREVQRLNATIATREALAMTADRQRRKEIEERERDLEARLQSVQEQVKLSQEMQQQLMAERKEIEEEKRLLEAEVLRQQDAAAELQKVIESFFPQDMYADSGLDLDDSELEELHRSGLSENFGSPPLCGSLNTSSHINGNTEDIIHDLHDRLNNIAVMWKSQDNMGMHLSGMHQESA